MIRNKNGLKKVVGNSIVIAIIGIGAIIFLSIGSIFLGSPPMHVIIALIVIYVLSIVTSLLVGTYVYKSLNIETINSLKDLPSRFNEMISYWRFKDLVVDARGYLPKREMVVFGVDFSITGGNSQESDEERERLLKILKQKNLKVTFICTPHVREAYPLILDNINRFLQKVNFKEIKEKIEIYRRITNPLQARVILLDHNLALYQLGLYASDDFRLNIQNLAIKIYDEKAVQWLYYMVEGWKNESERIDLEEMWQELQV